MRYASPLRYPGGKAALASLLRAFRAQNGLEERAIAEPFAGGAGASLTLLYEGSAPSVLINDLDPAIRDFWWAALHRSSAFLEHLEASTPTVAEWESWRAEYHEPSTTKVRRGFAAFFLNRCNRSGIIEDGSVIGGLQQTGKWKIDARFNKVALRKRLEELAAHRDQIAVSGQDGIDFIDATSEQQPFYFIDPPYFGKGPTLYMNGLDQPYHARLAEKLKSMVGATWVLTYDDCPEIRALYEGWAEVRSFSLRYAAAEKRMGREVFITPPGLRLPAEQSSGAVTW